MSAAPFKTTNCNSFTLQKCAKSRASIYSGVALEYDMSNRGLGRTWVSGHDPVVNRLGFECHYVKCKSQAHPRSCFNSACIGSVLLLRRAHASKILLKNTIYSSGVNDDMQ